VRCAKARSPADAIQPQLAVGHDNLLVVGVSPRPGEALFFGQVATELLEKSPCLLPMVASEPFVASAGRLENRRANHSRVYLRRGWIR